MNSRKLSDATVVLLECMPAERIEYILKPKYINYPVSTSIFQALEGLMSYPKMHRMPNLLIVGDTGNGKTSIVKRFVAAHAMTKSLDSEREHIPILAFQAPPVPEEGRLYSLMLEALGLPKTHEAPDMLRYRLTHLVKRVGVKLIVIDELHNVNAGSPRKQAIFMNALRFLHNELEVPIVGVGIYEAEATIQADPQLESRFGKPMKVPRWTKGQDFRHLLAGFESTLPLQRPSNLSSPALAERLLGMCGGLLGNLCQLVQTAAIEAIKTGEEQITTTLLDRLEWQSPDQRRRVVRTAI